MSVTTQYIIQKYGESIAEEVNVKSVVELGNDIIVTKTYVPLGQKLGGAFGKDTARIISAAKAGNAEYHGDGTLTVTDGNDARTLSVDMYEIRWSGLEEDHQTVEGGVIISLDTTLTDALRKEGIARELSRFLNQMRKDAQFLIDDRVDCFWRSSDTTMQEVIGSFGTFLCDEALLKSLTEGIQGEGFSATYESDEGNISFILLK